MKYLPITLIYSRVFLGIVLVVVSLIDIPHYDVVAIILLTIGLLTDIFDGIVARQLGISTEKLRRLDSSVDQFFWAMVLVATYLGCREFFAANATKLLTLLALEGLTYVVCFLKFRKEIATHSWAAKLWVLISFAALVQVVATCASGWLFEICFYVGVVTRLEILAIVLLLKSWTHDVPSFYHAIRLRQNKPIKRHRLFNG